MVGDGLPFTAFVELYWNCSGKENHYCTMHNPHLSLMNNNPSVQQQG